MICPLLGVMLIAGVWAIVAAVYGKPLIVPKFSSVVVSFFKLFVSGKFYVDALVTLLRSAACFIVAYVVALPLSLLAAFNKTFAAVFKPFVEILRSVPVIAVILVALVMFSSSILPVVVGFLMVFPLIYSALLAAFTSEETTSAVEMCRLYKARNRDVLKYVYAPVVMPVSFCQAKTLMPLAVKVVVSGEALAYARRGLGLAMQSAQLNVETDRLIAYAVVATLLSYLCLGLVALAEICCRRLRLCR